MVCRYELVTLPVDGDHGDGEERDADVAVSQRRLEDAEHRWIGSKVFARQIVIGGEGHHGNAAHHVRCAQAAINSNRHHYHREEQLR